MSIHAAKAAVATSLLVQAAKAGHVHLVRHLLAQGANTRSLSWDGGTALQAAHDNGRGAVVLELLLAQGGVR